MNAPHLLLLSQGPFAPNMNLACLQTASLGWYACVGMETSCSWQQADYELLSAQRTFVSNMKLDQKSFKQQSLKCMSLLPWLQHFLTNKLYNLLSLPEGTCLPSLKFVPL